MRYHFSISTDCATITIINFKVFSSPHKESSYSSIQPYPPLIIHFISGSSRITADGDCSHKIKRHLLLGRKVMTNLDSILESRDITLPTKVCLVKAMVFPVVMYGCESWTVKKAESQRIDAFELWCWKSPLDCKEMQPVHSKGDQSQVFIGRTDAKAETPVLWPPHVKS